MRLDTKELPEKSSVASVSHQPRADGFWHAVADVKTPWSREGRLIGHVEKRMS